MATSPFAAPIRKRLSGIVEQDEGEAAPIGETLDEPIEPLGPPQRGSYETPPWGGSGDLSPIDIGGDDGDGTGDDLPIDDPIDPPIDTGDDLPIEDPKYPIDPPVLEDDPIEDPKYPIDPPVLDGDTLDKEIGSGRGGGPIDKTGKTPDWTPIDPAGGDIGVLGPPQKGVMTPPWTPSGGGPGGGDLRTAFMDRLMAMMNRKGPNIDAAIGAHRTASQRGAERQRALLAERAAASGINESGAMDTGVLGIEQDRGASDAAYEADLTQRGQDQNDQMIMQALGLGGGFLSSQDRLGLDRELGMGQLGLGRDRLNLDAATSEGQMNLQALMAILQMLQSQGAGAV